MASARAFRAWSWAHTWSSLVCTAFMLLLCLTGLPLIFSEEIQHLAGGAAEPAGPAGGARVSLDRMLEAARAGHAGLVVQYASPSDDGGAWYVTLAPTPAPTADYVSVAMDAHTGAPLDGPGPGGKGFMDVMLRLHTDLYAGLPGELFLGAMGLLLATAIVSGAVLYGPFMKKLDFGEVRRHRAPRIRWLDLHNLLGITTLAWFLVVAATGSINTLAVPLMQYWQNDALRGLLAPYRGQPLAPEAERAPAQRALDAALAAAPGMRLSFVAFPGTLYASPHHYAVFLTGAEPPRTHLYQPVLVDARTARVSAVPVLPWYLTALQVSRPLHFGDYGGLPMKALWALLDIASIIVLGSGLYLWLAKHRRGQSSDTAFQSR